MLLEVSHTGWLINFCMYNCTQLFMQMMPAWPFLRYNLTVIDTIGTKIFKSLLMTCPEFKGIAIYYEGLHCR